MADRRDNSGRESNQKVYSASQVENILLQLGLDIESETNHDFLGYCPYHGNRDTPSFSVSKTKGNFLCFNPACDVSGALVDLCVDIGKLNQFEARRLIIKSAGENLKPLHERIGEMLKNVEFKEFSQEAIDRMYEGFWQNDYAQTYMMQERGFTEETLRHFKVGYSDKKNLLAVPMHDPMGMPIGVIGRTLVGEKKFKNSYGLPKSKTTWNFHRAKRTGDTVIITEASFDAMRVHQAGYPNVIACLGGNFSEEHQAQLDRTFSTIIIMTDFDKKQFHVPICKKCQGNCKGHNPGRELGRSIAKKMSGKRILWASYEDRMVYPHGAKDAGDMTDDEIRQCLRNAVTTYKYNSFNLY